MLDPGQRSTAGTWWRRQLFGLGAEDRISLYEELRALTGAGIGVHEAFDSVLKRASGARRRALEGVTAAIQAGTEPGIAIASAPQAFPEIEAALIRAGERTGRYDRAFSDAAAQADRSRLAVRAAVQQLSYPALLVHVALLLPLPMVLGMAGHHAAAFAMTIGALILLWVLGGVVLTIHVGRTRDPHWGRFVCGLPVAGNAFRGAAVARFCAAAASLFDAGINLPEAIETAADCAGNGWLRGDAYAAAEAMRRGGGAAEHITKIGALPPESRSLLESGDLAGELASAFSRLGQLERDRAESALKKTTRLIHGVVFTCVAVGVAWMAFMVFVKPMQDALNFK